MIPLLLAGPAGSGKTHRCLAEIADHLRQNPSGSSLILIAPRQATYQLERQILSFPGVEGFTRLRILSFQRLAQFIFDVTGTAVSKLLDEDGRIMVLRAILARRRKQLRVYRESAQRDGLAQELSSLWREACEHRTGPAGFRKAAAKIENPKLRAKLEDFADIFEDYQTWLTEHALRDGDELLDIAADAALKGPVPDIAGLWLDGFAQMTPQERRLLNSILPKCAAATLAFCLLERPLQPGDAFAMWSAVARTYCSVREELTAVFNAPPQERVLPRRKEAGRFDKAPMLAHLEEYWGRPKPFEAKDACAVTNIRIFKCSNAEDEATFAAREILKFVRNGGRYREAAVLVRSLDDASSTLRRVFHRYGIPFFLDRREPVAHHPLAELTRGALRTIAFGFKHHDLFAALKSGLIGIEDSQVDWFENMSLARGWNGNDWRSPLNCGPKANDTERARAEEIRKRVFKPIIALERSLGAECTGSDLADALRKLWETLDIEKTLEAWAEGVDGTIHETVWTQMNEWLKSVELAFGTEKMPLVRWLEIVEAGLSSLTVGLIPPSLDQVLIGAVDRSRNPDLQTVFLVGVNERLFPKAGSEPLLLNDGDREVLAEAGVHLGVSTLWNLGAEQFYGYIACTRARSALNITYSVSGSDGAPMNPSLFIAHLQRLFPNLEEELFSGVAPIEAEHTHELNRLIFAEANRKEPPSPLAKELSGWPVLAPVWERARISISEDLPNLKLETVQALYGSRLNTSVSKLEQFAMCPFRFFVASGLRAQERLLFELDRREEGSFQHEILAEFHRRVEAQGKRWREVSPKQGRELVEKIGAELKSQFQEGLANATASNRFRAEAKLAALQDFIEVYLELLRDCAFDPRHVELGFGGKDGSLIGWQLQIDETRAVELMGRIDRVDVWVDAENKCCYALVYDYKSSDRKLDRTLVEHAIQQQLPAYLAALQKIGGLEQFPFEVRAAGGFYVNLRAKMKGAKSRAEAFDPKANDSERDLKQSGVFDYGLIERLDSKRSGKLFDYNVKSGPKRSAALKALEPFEFAELLSSTEHRLRQLGGRIFAGEIAMKPYRHGNHAACDTCFYGGICRIDPWTHEFRSLK